MGKVRMYVEPSASYKYLQTLLGEDVKNQLMQLLNTSSHKATRLLSGADEWTLQELVALQSETGIHIIHDFVAKYDDVRTNLTVDETNALLRPHGECLVIGSVAA